jgi:F-type H+-transporting ATPase subunit delta
MPSSNVDIKAYAGALLSLAGAAGIMDSIEQELAAAVELFDDGTLRSFAHHPRVQLQGRSRGLDELLDGKVHPVLRHFFLILLENGVLRELRDIAGACYAELAERRQRTSGELVTAAEIGAEKVAQIEEEASRILGKTVRLRVRVDPQLVGGLAVHVGDFILDGSIENQLESIRRTILTERTAE